MFGVRPVLLLQTEVIYDNLFSVPGDFFGKEANAHNPTQIRAFNWSVPISCSFDAKFFCFPTLLALPFDL